MNPWAIAVAGIGALGTGVVLFGNKPKATAPVVKTDPNPAVPAKTDPPVAPAKSLQVTSLAGYHSVGSFPDRWTKPPVVPITDGKDKAVLLTTLPVTGKSVSAEVRVEIEKIVKPSEWTAMKADVKAKAIGELNKQLGLNLPPNASLNQVGDAMIAKGARETGNAIGGALCGPPCAAVVANIGGKFGDIIGRHVNLSSLTKKATTKVKRVVGRWF